MVVSTAASAEAQLVDFDSTVATVQQLVLNHRYREVLDLLEPLEEQTENRETRYIIAAELGRAYFHLGEYPEAHLHLRHAVTIHPERIETALYLEATSYLLGDRAQALEILRALLRSDARDLYLAVTLPGERQFLADPEVWQLLEEHAIDVEIDIARGRIGSVALGEDRRTVARALGAPDDASQGSLTARAGPRPIWWYGFSEADQLTEVVLYNENMAKYSRYRLRIGNLGWRATPAALTAALGPADSLNAGDGITMGWRLPELTLEVAFGHPRAPRPPLVGEHVAMMLLVRVVRPGQGANPDSGRMSP
jgi:tetratricopeptide (TPR) repeat protein